MHDGYIDEITHLVFDSSDTHPGVVYSKILTIASSASVCLGRVTAVSVTITSSASFAIGEIIVGVRVDVEVKGVSLTEVSTCKYEGRVAGSAH